MKFCVFICLCTFLVPMSVQGHKILVIVPLHGISHWNYMKVFIEKLINRGDEVTCITNISMGKHKPVNYTEILIDPPLELQNFVKPENIFKWSMNSPWPMILGGAFSFGYTTKYALENQYVQHFIHSANHHFDLIIIEDLWHDTFLMLGHQFKAPIVSICPYGIAGTSDFEMGLLTPMSHVPNTMLDYSDQMDFFQRWHNAMTITVGQLMHNFIHCPLQNYLANKYFAHLEQPLPTIQELRKNISVVFANVHRSIIYPRPHMPGMVYIGGAHIKPPKTLPNDLQRFLDESPHGVIYFSLGSMARGSKMPKETFNAFLDVFGQLKQRVIWKFDGESIANQPKNVLISKWLPQTDLLAHPNIVLFISHGGMFSNFEAINYGIQMLFVPLAGDQFRNGIRAENLGYAKMLNFRDITRDTLHDVLNEMLINDKYAMRAKEISSVFRDNVVHPMDEFIWWIEHVIKFRGTKYLKSHAADMSLFTYLSIDVILANVIVAVIFTFGFYFAIKNLCCKTKTKAKTIDKNKKTKTN